MGCEELDEIKGAVPGEPLASPLHSAIHSLGKEDNQRILIFFYLRSRF